MLYVIENSFKEVIEVKSAEEARTKRSEIILNAIEEAGMLPPPYELENVAPHVLYYRMNKDVDIDSYMIDTLEERKLLWDEEDD